MNCKAARKLFSATFDGELSVSEEREFKAHLAECSECSREFKLFAKSVELVSSLPRPSTSPLFEQKLIQALSAEKTVPLRPEPRVPPLVPRPAVAFAAAVSLVILLVMVPRNQSDWENGLVVNQLAMSELAMDELAATQLALSESDNIRKQSPAVAGLDDALVSAGEEESFPGEGLSFWSRDTRMASAGPTDDVVALLDDVAVSSGAILQTEFVLDPFLFEGAEVRRLDSRSTAETEVELVSMTF